ncbi:HAMP domain-containing sensor histidine kinase [Cesiribacter sp. SM1]|uniref:HAMP domain-containing sensor histidine kinase n=1 Tax=Cesiribacter sp. SM1 TaxID=2861196 RepID=UPI001CD325E9|nr:HAMP domain-containing sensor histidine kinase [Cesiribacter sp. SM1]
MSIRKKILIYFSVVTILLVGVALVFIYELFYEYRAEEFHDQQKTKIVTTLKLLTKVRNIDEQVIRAMDQITINELYDEKLLIFDEGKRLIYSSIDDTQIPYAQKLLEKLSPEAPWLAHKDGQYDVTGMYYKLGNQAYYGISKAYDVSGNHNLNYLKYELSLTFLCMLIIVIVMSHYLARRITHPIVQLTKQINEYDFEVSPAALPFPASKNEVAILTLRFNELMNRMKAAYSFQKHAVHHISHELKTPIAILVSNFEKIEKETDRNKMVELIKIQKDQTMNLNEIINYLLEIAKTESENIALQTQVRVDELIFDLADELKRLHPEFQFSIEYTQSTDNDNSFTVLANDRLLKAALMNIMMNCIQYSSDHKARIDIDNDPTQLRINFTNKGPILQTWEEPSIFQRFFRGENSQDKLGFGLGLVFVHKIMDIHGGQIFYRSEEQNLNVFSIIFPLS